MLYTSGSECEISTETEIVIAALNVQLQQNIPGPYFP